MNDTELKIEAFRASHQVKLVEGGQEGTAITSVPNGTYGHTYSPNPEAGTPVFRRKAYRSFEVHRDGSGAIHYIGYVSPAEADKVESGADYVELSLFPDPMESANVPISVPYSRIINKNLSPLRIEGNPLPLKIGPVQ